MNKPTKIIVLTITAQAACLMLGLWIHERYIVSAARWTAQREVWGKLAACADHFSPVVEGSDRFPQPHEGTAQVSAIVNAGCLPPGVNALIVDPAWRLMAAADPSGSERAARHWNRGETVTWQSQRGREHPAGDLVAGTILLPQGPHLAVVRGLLGPDRFSIVYWKDTAIEPSGPALKAMLPAAGVLTFIWICGLQSVVICLVMVRVHADHSQARLESEEDRIRRTQDLVRTRDVVIFGLAKLAESRDLETGHHLERMSLYSTRLASELNRRTKYREVVTPAFVRSIGVSAALHDIGKVGTEDAILLKPGKLTAAERTRMQLHANIGGECLRQIEQRLGGSNFLEMAREIALYHHERWDGTGYPLGLAGEAIPLAARIVAIADVYDALSARRTYKESYPHEQCVQMISEQSGSHFDPDLVEVFLDLESQFVEIAQSFTETKNPSVNRRSQAAESMGGKSVFTHDLMDILSASAIHSTREDGIEAFEHEAAIPIGIEPEGMLHRNS